MATCRLGTKSEKLNTRIELILTLWFKVDHEGLKCLQQLKDENTGSKKEAILFYLEFTFLLCSSRGESSQPVPSLQYAKSSSSIRILIRE